MTTGDVRSDIVANNRRFMEDFHRKEAASLAALYTGAGQLLPPNSPPVSGPTGIQAFWQGAMDAGIAQVTLETVDAEGHGETAIEVGRYTLLAAGGQVADAGKYLVVWKREEGAWKLHRDIWNSNGPAAS
jgi:ketosteroid isomerase-like protein